MKIFEHNPYEVPVEKKDEEAPAQGANEKAENKD